jgi:steroid delta-isomerase-like uncharacterized protein
MSRDDNQAKLLRWIEAWNTGDLGQLDEVFAADSVYHVPPFPDLIGLEAHKQFITDARQAYPDFHLRLEEVIDAGERTAMRWTWQGTFSAPTAAIPVPPTGKHAIGPGCHIIHWANGKVAETWHIGDWLGMLQQFGVIPAPEAAPA